MPQPDDQERQGASTQSGLDSPHRLLGGGAAHPGALELTDALAGGG